MLFRSRNRMELSDCARGGERSSHDRIEMIRIEAIDFDLVGSHPPSLLWARQSVGKDVESCERMRIQTPRAGAQSLGLPDLVADVALGIG